jgi:hypothetical protein
MMQALVLVLMLVLQAQVLVLQVLTELGLMQVPGLPGRVQELSEQQQVKNLVRLHLVKLLARPVQELDHQPSWLLVSYFQSLKHPSFQ